MPIMSLVEYSPIMSVKYSLPVPAFHFWPKLTLAAHRVNIRLIFDPSQLTKAVSKVTIRQSEVINEDLVMVRAARKTVTLNKPILVGFTVLEISKFIMYHFITTT